jgi:8-oxo-dGTP pyrophosphatase MutT (NUDIX family)
MPHIHDKIDFTVEVYVVNGDRVLLREHDKYGLWLSVGGHVELDEDPNQAALREVEEEVGLEVKLYEPEWFTENKSENYQELIPPYFINRHRIDENHEHVTLVYFASSDSRDLRLSESEKSDEVKWFSLDELDDPIYGISDNVKRYARTALNKLG